MGARTRINTPEAKTVTEKPPIRTEKQWPENTGVSFEKHRGNTSPMITSALQQIVGLRITFGGSVHDYFQILFENGAVLNIFNKFNFISPRKDIIDSSIQDIQENENEIIFSLVNDAKLRVGLNDDDWNGPESFQLTLSNGETIIWN